MLTCHEDSKVKILVRQNPKSLFIDLATLLRLPNRATFPDVLRYTTGSRVIMTRRSGVMKRVVSVFVSGLAAMALTASFAMAEDLKIAFVDLQQVLGKSAKAKDHAQKLEQLIQAKQASLEKMRKELVELGEELQKTGGMLKEEKRLEMQNKIAVKKTEFELATKNAEEAVQKENGQLQQTFLRDVGKIITKVREQHKLALVIDSRAILSAEDPLNLTEEVAKLYDAEPSDGGKPKPGAAAPPKAPAAAQPKTPR